MPTPEDSLLPSQKNTIALEVVGAIAFNAGYGHDSELCEAANRVLLAIRLKKIIQVMLLGDVREVELNSSLTVAMLFKMAFGDNFDSRKHSFRLDGICADALDMVTEANFLATAKALPDVAIA